MHEYSFNSTLCNKTIKVYIKKLSGKCGIFMRKLYFTRPQIGVDIYSIVVGIVVETDDES